VSDIPGASSCAVFSQYAASLQDQSKAPDIHSLSLRASTEELSDSFNVQDQVPDDSYTQDHQFAPCIFVGNPHKDSQVLASLGYSQSKTSFNQVH
jgi:hypothetical protein